MYNIFHTFGLILSYAVLKVKLFIMKRLITLSTVVLFLIACSSSNKQLEQGNYDAVLIKAAKKIKRDPGKFQEVDNYNHAYRMAYTKDNDEINRLKAQGNPANWSKIHTILLRMKGRQDLAKSLPPVGITIHGEKDFDGEINDAKVNATGYAYDKGVELLAKNNKLAARDAHKHFLQAKKYDTYYKDVDNKLAEAKFKGTMNVFFTIENKSGAIVPEGMMAELQNINLNDLNKEWLDYDTYADTNKLYDYAVTLNMKQLVVSPEGLKEKAYSESKEIEDGTEYVLDGNGNVKKDSLGNDVKVPKFKTITCNVTDFHQSKTAQISGTIDYFNTSTNSLMKSEPIVADAIFAHDYAVANGNLAALKPETKKKAEVKPLPFPDDASLTLQAGEVLKKMTKDILVKNKEFLK